MTRLACRRCGCEHVEWRQRRDGSYYLATALGSHDASDKPGRYWAKVARRPHECPMADGTPRCGHCYAAARDAQYRDADHRRYVEALRTFSAKDLEDPRLLATAERMAASWGTEDHEWKPQYQETPR